MSSGKHEDSVCMMVRGFAGCAAKLLVFFFGILHLVSLYFCIIFWAALATQLLHAGRVKKGSRTRETHGRADRRGRLTVSPLHVLHVCVSVNAAQ